MARIVGLNLNVDIDDSGALALDFKAEGEAKGHVIAEGQVMVRDLASVQAVAQAVAAKLAGEQ